MHQTVLDRITQSQTDELLALLCDTFPEKEQAFRNIWQYCDDDGTGPGRQFYELWITGADWLFYGN